MTTISLLAARQMIVDEVRIRSAVSGALDQIARRIDRRRAWSAPAMIRHAPDALPRLLDTLEVAEYGPRSPEPCPWRDFQAETLRDITMSYRQHHPRDYWRRVVSQAQALADDSEDALRLALENVAFLRSVKVDDITLDDGDTGDGFRVAQSVNLFALIVRRDLGAE